MFIEIRLCNLTDVFKGRTKFAKKFNVPILNRLKIMGFL